MLPQLTAAVLLAQGCYEAFSQKGVQPPYGRPFLEEIQRKFTLSYNFMGKHAFWTASFPYLAKCLDVTMRHLHLPQLLHG